MTKEAEIWIGVDQEGLLVFDSRLQIDGCQYTVFWNQTSCEAEKYDWEEIHATISPLEDDVVISKTLAEYSLWYEMFGKKWVEKEKKFYESRKAALIDKEIRRKQKRKRAIKNHASLLRKYDLPAVGARPKASHKAHRKTHCFNCSKLYLDNFVDLECARCGWIICECGACGCVYKACR